MVLLMGPPGCGKSTLGNELARIGIGDYTELEPLLVQKYGTGEEFARKRPQIHRWIWSYYRNRLSDVDIPVVMETTGISGRDFLAEIDLSYRLLYAKFDTPQALCVDRVLSREQGRHVNDSSRPEAVEFYEYWHEEIKDTYTFDLSLSGVDLKQDVQAIRMAIEALPDEADEES